MINSDKSSSSSKTYVDRLTFGTNVQGPNSFIRNVFDLFRDTFTKPIDQTDIVPFDIEPVIEKKEPLISKETEGILLRKLDNFEAALGFKNPNLSLAFLSVELQTNTKYLSYVINTHKKKDFNTYINDLRVFYFITIIKETPTYLNYKISYLSKECGFASHSRFATVFKNTTGVTPSAFLNQVKGGSMEENICPKAV